MKRSQRNSKYNTKPCETKFSWCFPKTFTQPSFVLIKYNHYSHYVAISSWGGHTLILTHTPNQRNTHKEPTNKHSKYFVIKTLLLRFFPYFIRNKPLISFDLNVFASGKNVFIYILHNFAHRRSIVFQVFLVCKFFIFTKYSMIHEMKNEQQIILKTFGNTTYLRVSNWNSAIKRESMSWTLFTKLALFN